MHYGTILDRQMNGKIIYNLIIGSFQIYKK